jgi:ribonuclease HI
VQGLTYRIYSDGAAKGNPGPAGIGAVILDDEGRTLMEIAESIGKATNNVAEYSALVEALKKCRLHHWAPVEVFADSELMIRQLQGRYKVRHPGIVPLYEEARRLLGDLGCSGLQHIPREQNREADRLSNLGVAKGAGSGK